MQLVAVVDDNEKVLMHHSTIVQKIKGFSLLGEFKSGIDIILYCQTHKILPNIILMDIEMPNFDGLQTTDFLNSYFPQIKIIAISSHSHDDIVKDMLLCGAYGYIQKVKNDFGKRIIAFDVVLKNALQAIANNERYLDERFREFYELPNPDELVRLRQNEKNLQRKQFNISKIEQELVLLCPVGLSYKQLGNICNKSPRTVETEIRGLIKKLDAGKGQHGLFSFAITNNLIKIAKLFSNNVN